MRLTLKPHPDTPCDAVREIAVEAGREGDWLRLRYRLEGDVQAILWPETGEGQRSDDLWKHTCFEAFLKPLSAVSSPLGSLLPSREKVSPKATDEGAHRPLTQPAATSTQLNDLGAPSSGASRHLLPRGEKGDQEAPAYIEINLSPGLDWAMYGFTGYRSGMTPTDDAALGLTCHRGETTFELNADISVEDAPSAWRLAISAVIELTDGSKSYWALTHAPGKPDFHHPDAFTLTLPPESP